MPINPWFRVTQQQAINILHLSLPDTLDSIDMDRLIEDIMQSLSGRASGRWVIDLTEVRYMGSSILGLMVNIRERVRQSRGRLVICGMSNDLLRVFQTCCLERLFTISQTIGDAVAALAA